MIYRQDSIRQLQKNDTRRYFNSDELAKELVPQMMKLDKYFCQTRKYILEKYNIKDEKAVDNELKPNRLLQKLTSNPLNYYRALESEKDKQEYLKVIHRNMGTGLNKKKQVIN